MKINDFISLCTFIFHLFEYLTNSIFSALLQHDQQSIHVIILKNDLKSINCLIGIICYENAIFPKLDKGS